MSVNRHCRCVLIQWKRFSIITIGFYHQIIIFIMQGLFYVRLGLRSRYRSSRLCPSICATDRFRLIFQIKTQSSIKKLVYTVLPVQLWLRLLAIKPPRSLKTICYSETRRMLATLVDEGQEHELPERKKKRLLPPFFDLLFLFYFIFTKGKTHSSPRNRSRYFFL